MLIGAHTIGQIRNTFGEALPWVFNGDDHATADGPVFDNAFHNFLINDIVATNEIGFFNPWIYSRYFFPPIFFSSINDSKFTNFFSLWISFKV